MAGLEFSQIITNKELFEKAVVQKTMQKSALIQSGIMENDKQFDELASESATIHNMPFFKDLTGDAQVVIEGQKLTPNGINMDKDVSTTLRFAQMWSATDLSASFAGKDPMDVITSLAADYWQRQLQKTTLCALEGAFESTELKTSNVLDISSLSKKAAVIDASSILDATQLLGDAKGLLTGIVMHSMTHNALLKQNLIETIKPSDGSADIPYYLGKRVIIDDNCPVAGDVYTTYLFGTGAIAFGNGNPVGHVPVGFKRDEDMGSGVNYMINRKVWIVHPRGVAWENKVRAHVESVSFEELKNNTNWKRVYDPKQVRMVAFKHKVAPGA